MDLKFNGKFFSFPSKLLSLDFNFVSLQVNVIIQKVPAIFDNETSKFNFFIQFKRRQAKTVFKNGFPFNSVNI